MSKTRCLLENNVKKFITTNNRKHIFFNETRLIKQRKQNTKLQKNIDHTFIYRMKYNYKFCTSKF